MAKGKVKETVMLYKYPGKTKMYDRKSYDYLIVEKDEVEEATKDGWSRTPEAAVKKAEAKKPAAKTEK